MVKNTFLKLINYSLLVLFFAVLHTLNVIITNPDVNAKLVFLSNFMGRVCAVGSASIVYNLSSLLVFSILIINYIAYLKAYKHNFILKEVVNYVICYNLFFISLLWTPNKLIFYFPYLKEVTRLSLIFDLGHYTVIYIITVLLLLLVVIGHFKIKKLKVSTFFYSLFSFSIYVIGIRVLVYIAAKL